MEAATPRVREIILKLKQQIRDLDEKIEKLAKRYNLSDDEEPLELLPAIENIVDRKKEKKRHLKSYKIEIKECMVDPEEYECLDG